eukprot:scaffold7199_cov444-Prasinococcus_capsulatus_cf.AAC.1
MSKERWSPPLARRPADTPGAQPTEARRRAPHTEGAQQARAASLGSGSGLCRAAIEPAYAHSPNLQWPP